MNVRQLLLLSFCLAAVGAASPALAQGESVNTGQGFGEFYISAAPDRYEPIIEVPLSVPTPIYVLANVDYAAIGRPDQNELNGISAWEAQVPLPATLFVVGLAYNPPSSLAVPAPEGPVYNFSVGTGTPLPAENGLTVLVTITVLATAEISGFEIVPGAVDNPSVPGEAVWVDAQPVGAECFTPSGPIGCIRPFEVLGGAIINPEPVSDESRSFGAIKSLYE